MSKYLKNRSIPDLINSEGDILAIYKEEETDSPRLMMHLKDNKGKLFTRFNKETLISYLECKASIREVIDSSGNEYLVYENKEKNCFNIPKTIFDYQLLWFSELSYCQIDDSYKPTSVKELIKIVEVM